MILEQLINKYILTISTDNIMITFILYLVYDLFTNIIAFLFLLEILIQIQIIIKLIFKYTNIYFN